MSIKYCNDIKMQDAFKYFQIILKNKDEIDIYS